jgi:hypothetical protein
VESKGRKKPLASCLTPWRRLSNVEIAERLSLRAKTVESQLRRLFDRYDVASRTALVRLAARQGWIEDDR